MESGVLDKGDIQKVQGRGPSRTGLGSTGLVRAFYSVFCILSTFLVIFSFLFVLVFSL